MKTESVDVLVIGAGPAGNGGCFDYKQGWIQGSDRGENEISALRDRGKPFAALHGGVGRSRIFRRGQRKKFQEKFGAKIVKNGKVCDFRFADQFTPGWTWTWQVPRADFDQTLADTVEKMGVPVQYESTVTGIDFQGSDSITTVEDIHGQKSQIKARFIIDGSGYGRVIPKLFKLDKPSNLPPRKALFVHAADPQRSSYDEPNRIAIVVHQPGVWIWVIPFANGNTSLGFVGDPEFFKRVSGNPEAQLRQLITANPYICERFKAAEFIFEPKTVESWSSTTTRFFGDGFVLTGNVTEFLDPVFSSGVTLAVVSSQIAGHLVVEKLKGRAIDWDSEYMRPMMQGVDTFRSYVMAWYEGTLDTIFFSEDKDPLIQSQICSVLAGYVWDQNNPYVKHHKTALQRLVSAIRYRDSLANPA